MPYGLSMFEDRYSVTSLSDMRLQQLIVSSHVRTYNYLFRDSNNFISYPWMMIQIMLQSLEFMFGSRTFNKRLAEKLGAGIIHSLFITTARIDIW